MTTPAHLQDESQVVKAGGWCYDGCGYIECHFLAISSDATGDKCTCQLFNHARLLNGAKSLYCCNKIYGYDYVGEA